MTFINLAVSHLSVILDRRFFQAKSKIHSYGERTRTMKRLFGILGFLAILALSLGGDNAVAQEEFEFGLGDIGFDPIEYQSTLRDYTAPPYAASAPTDPAFDWRDYGAVTPAKNQGSCGSCWAFACVGVLESKIILNGGPVYDLAEQQQVSCNLRYDPSAGGCCGGNYYAFDFWCANGPMEESCASYGDGSTACPQNRNVVCGSLSCSELPYHLTDKFTVVTSDVSAVKTSLDQDGPAYFSFTVYSDFYTYWSSGSPGSVYTQTSGDLRGGHAVLLIGWDDSKSAWLLKNSWGTSGGPNGDGTFWMAWSGHTNNLSFGMANAELVQSSDCMDCPIRSLGTPGSAIDLKVSGSFAYVADYSSFLQIIDISNPLSPQLAGSVAGASYACGIAVAGSYAYVTDRTLGLYVVNISDPFAPSISGSVETPNDAWDVAVSGSYAFVADNTSGLHVVDISDPSAPSIVGSVDTTGIARGVDVSGSYAYVADATSGLQVIDISNPAVPSIIGSADTPSNARKVDVSGSYAYVADASGLQVIDISDPAAPFIVGAVDTPGDAYGVFVYGSNAYVADLGEGLQVIDISTPTAPTIINSVETSAYYRVESSGPYIYMAGGNFLIIKPCVDCLQSYPDSDGDGYGDSGDSQCYYGPYGQYVVAQGGDCNDADPDVNPGQAETTCNGTDDDCNAGTLDNPPDGDGDLVTICAGDCDDNDANNYPGNTETCDGQDNDCDTLVDDDDPGCTGQPTWYEDFDGDTYGNPALSATQCSQPGGYVADNTDCDDNDADNYPGNTEICDGQDNDCDSLVDAADPDCTGLTTYYRDDDGDIYGVDGDTQNLCSPSAPYTATQGGDCDDTDPDVNPGETETICNGKDDDCNAGTLDSPPDGDGDLVTICAGDCDDTDPNNYPGNAEICDGQDNDCDDLVDAADPDCTGLTTYYRDDDGDTYGVNGDTQNLCGPSAPYTATQGGDCNDANGLVNPGATEICDDGIDNDCDDLTDSLDPDCAGPQTIYVDDDGTCPGSGTIGDPYCEIQTAINDSANGDVITVRDGTYIGANNRDLDFNGKAVTLQSENGAASTIIDCENSGRGFTFDDGEASDSVVDGFTIINGYVTGSEPDSSGGGILCYDSSPSIRNSVINNCEAGTYGGGIACRDSTALIGSAPIISGCIITGNMSISGGGGIHCYWSSPSINNSVLVENTSATYGGALYHWTSNASFANCTISRNSANHGGAISAVSNSSITVANSILWGDTAGVEGSEIALYDDGTELSVSYSDVEGGELAAEVDGTSTLTWGSGNIDPVGADPLFENPPDFVDWTTGAGTTTTVEVADATIFAVDDVIEYNGDGVARTVSSAVGTTVTFAPALSGASVANRVIHNFGIGGSVPEDLHLRACSPAIDAGDLASDISNEPQPNGERINMGAYGNTADATKAAHFYDRFFASAPDIGGGSADELVFLGENPSNQKVLAQVWDAETAVRTKNVWYGPVFKPIGVAVVPDINGNGKSEICLLGRNPLNNKVLGHVRDGATGTYLRYVWFGAKQAPVGMKVMEDISGNGKSELVMMARDPDNNKGVAKVYDSATGSMVKLVWYGPVFDTLGLEIISDSNGNGKPDIVQMALNPDNRKVLAHIRDSLTGVWIRYLWFGTQYYPIDLKTVPDVNGNGYDELALLGVDYNTGEVVVKVMDSYTRATLRIRTYFTGYTPIALEVLPDMNGGGRPELAVLAVDPSDGTVYVSIKDSRSGEVVADNSFGSTHEPWGIGMGERYQRRRQA